MAQNGDERFLLLAKQARDCDRKRRCVAMANETSNRLFYLYF